MSEPKTRNVLSFPQQLALHKWLEANGGDICRQQWTRDQTAFEAQKALGFRVTDGNITGTIDTLPAFDWPWVGRVHPGSDIALREKVAELSGQVDQLFRLADTAADKNGVGIEIQTLNKRLGSITEAVANISAAITDMRTIIEVLDSEYRSLVQNDKEIRSVVVKLGGDVDRIAEQVGMVKLNNAAVRAAVAGVQAGGAKKG